MKMCMIFVLRKKNQKPLISMLQKILKFNFIFDLKKWNLKYLDSLNLYVFEISNFHIFFIGFFLNCWFLEFFFIFTILIFLVLDFFLFEIFECFCCILFSIFLVFFIFWNLEFYLQMFQQI